jgi:hypothetical protein
MSGNSGIPLNYSLKIKEKTNPGLMPLAEFSYPGRLSSEFGRR